MAQNRFRRVFYEPTTELHKHNEVEFFPDLTGLKEITAGYQAVYDAQFDVPIPKHNNYDRQYLQEEYLQPIDDLRNTSVEAFAQGSTVDGIRALSELQRFIKKSKQPGGVYDAFETRYAAEQSAQEHWNKFFEDDPRLAGWAIGERVHGRDRFRDPSGGFQAVSPDQNVVRHIAQEDIQKFINSNLGQIKDTLINMGYDAKKIESFTTLHEFAEYMGRDFGEVLHILEQRITPDMRLSLEQQYMAERYYDPRVPDQDPNQVFQYERDAEGNVTGYKLDEDGVPLPANTWLARELYAAAFGRARIDPQFQRIKSEDKVGYEMWKEQRENEVQTMYSRIASPISAMPEWSIDKGTSGLTKTNIRREWTGNVEHEFRDVVQLGTVSDFLPNALGGQLEAQAPGLQNIATQFQPYLENLADQGKYDEIYDFMQNKYNEVRDKFNHVDVQYDFPEEGGTQWNNANKYWVDAGGMQNHGSFYVIDPTGKIPPGAMTYEQMASLLKIDDTDRGENVLYNGEVIASSDRAPSGNMYTVNRNGVPYHVIGADRSVEQTALNLVPYTLSQTLYSPSSAPTGRVVPDMARANPDGTVTHMVEDYPEGVYGRRREYYQSDALRDEMNRQQDLLVGKTGEERARIQSEIDRLDAEITKLESNPWTNRLIDFKVDIYDGRYHPGLETGMPEKKLGGHDMFQSIIEYYER